MKKLLMFVLAFTAITLTAENIVVTRTDNIVARGTTNQIVKMEFTSTLDTMHFVTETGDTVAMEVDSIIDITVGTRSKIVTINYCGDSAVIDNPFAFCGVNIYKDGCNVVVNSTIDEEVEYRLQGTSANGCFKVYSTKKYVLSLDNVSLTNPKGAAINSQSKKKVTVNILGTNMLCDGSSYQTVSGEDMKATFFAEGDIVINGNGTLTVASLKKHGICSDDKIVINGATIVMDNIKSDGLHANDVIEINSGELNINIPGDAIDGDAGIVTINGGQLTLGVTGDTKKAIKCDSTLTIAGGVIDITLSGNVVVDAGDPSYCTAIKTKQNLIISGGDITINHSGTAGKGISCDGDMFVSGGVFDITTRGNGGTYTDATNATDSYCSTGIKCDGNLTIVGGVFTLSSSGTAGKGISCDGELVIGDTMLTTVPTITVSTTGNRIFVSSGYGWGDNTDYANPKAIKAVGDVTINAGVFDITTTNAGGEGIESKAQLTINGGTLVLHCYDDCLNARTAIVINGGQVYCQASNNDGVDSNGTLTINGGLVLSCGANRPEEGFDCDQNTFKITGGIVIGLGGATSSPTASVCTQHAVVYNNLSATSNQLYHIEDANGNEVVTFTVPRAISQMCLLVSAPNISNGSYTIYKGGTYNNATFTWQNYQNGGVYSNGSSAGTFTVSSMVTTVGGTSGPGGGGGRP